MIMTMMMTMRIKTKQTRESVGTMGGVLVCEKESVRKRETRETKT